MTRRLILSYLIVAAFVLGVVEIPLGLTYAGRAEDRLLSAIERDARVLAGLLEERIEAGDSTAVTAITEDYASGSAARVVVTDPGGLSMVDSADPSGSPRDFSTRPEFAAALAGSQDAGIRYSETLGEELAVVAVPVTSAGTVTGAVRVSFATDSLRSQIRGNWLRLALLAVLVLCAAASFGWLVARWAIGPVAALEAGAQRLAAGDLSGRAEVERGPPELRRLAGTFNDMAARVETLVDSQRSFVADASHQLRTPLTALRLRIDSLGDSLEDSVVTPAAQEDLDAVAEELDRLMRLVDGLLAMARSGTRAVAEVVDVAAEARSAAQRWEALAAESSISIMVDVPEVALARVVGDGIDQVLDNLIDNAIGFAPGGSSIDVSVAREVPAPVPGAAAGDRSGGQVRLRVRDRGPGLDPVQRERATDRFWRAPGSPGGGTGLGLSIVSELSRRSGGGTELREPDDGPGLVVEVWFPASSETHES